MNPPSNYLTTDNQSPNFSTFTWNHYNNQHISELKNILPKKQYMPKPQGLYFAIDNQWLQWCDSEKFYTSTNSHCHTLTNIIELRILDIEECKDFNKYICKDRNSISFFLCNINWNIIAEEGYDGIYISNNLINSNDYEHMIMWSLYDVATIVVWNASKCKLQCKFEIMKEIKEEIKKVEN
jgi:hypothetical protein